MEIPETHSLEEISSRIRALAIQKPRILVGIFGAVGSGKSYLATALTRALPESVSFSMDGFHFTRAQLAAMPNASLAFEKRGAPWTFDAANFVSTLQRVNSGEEEVVGVPGWDHSVKDPVFNAAFISRKDKIVISEGLYLALDEDPWRKGASLFDLLIYVDVDEDTRRKRTVARHLKSGICPTKAAAEARYEHNDAKNSVLVIEHQARSPDIIFINREASLVE